MKKIINVLKNYYCLSLKIYLFIYVIFINLFIYRTKEIYYYCNAKVTIALLRNILR